MARSVPIIHAFNGGELSPLLNGRNDQDKYHNGCRQLRDFIPTIQGPATRRGGTRYVGAVKTSANRTWLANFKFSLYQNYALEFGDQYIRFWTNHGQLLNGGVPYEVVSPYLSADLTTASNTFALRFAQSGDVLYIAHASDLYPPYKLSRLGATNWTMVKVPFSDGPFQGVDPQNTVTLAASANTGAVTMTASAPVFDPTDVGTSIYMEVNDPSLADAWQSGVAHVANDLVSNNGNFYEATNAATSKGNPPTHVRGSASDGAVTWAYRHSGYAVVQITGYIDTQHVTGTILTGWKTGAQPVKMPYDMTAAGFRGSASTTRWSLSKFSALRGWPVDVKFFRSRLAYIAGNWLAVSQSGLYDSFTLLDGPQALETCGILLQLPVESLSWLAASTSLLLGTPSSERSIQEQATAKAFAADNIREQPETNFGAAAIEALALPTSTLIVQRTLKRVRELTYDPYKARYAGEDLTVLSEHLFDAGVTGIAYAQEPDSLIWCVRAEGTLASCSYNRERGVIAWALHTLGGGGFVESATVIPSPDGTVDDLWLIVRRTINGHTVRYVEYMTDRKAYKTGLQNAFFSDCGITYSGAATKVISGLSHLEGQTVDVLLDGSPAASQIVAGGTITMSRAGSVAQIGLHQTPIVEPMLIDADGPDGTGQTRNKAIANLYLRFVETVGGAGGPALDAQDPLGLINFGQPVNQPSGLFTGDKQIVWDHGFPDTEARIVVTQPQPLPMTLVAIVPRVEVND